MVFLLDTNIVSEVIRNPDGHVASRVDSELPSNICTSAIVAAELRFGAIRRGSPRLTERLGELLDAVIVLPFESPADEHYGRIRTDLERAGVPIGHMDLLIAAHAVALGHTLVTDNEREFRRIDGLTVENWLRRRA